jgi:hypothetical protein
MVGHIELGQNIETVKIPPLLKLRSLPSLFTSSTKYPTVATRAAARISRYYRIALNICSGVDRERSVVNNDKVTATENTPIAL